jgi:hypothetical protein
MTAPGNATEQFLGPEGEWGGCRLELHDVNWLWGGTAVFLDGTGHGAVWIVKAGGVDRAERFQVTVATGRLAALLRLFIESDFVSIPSSSRPGVPDETRVTLALWGPHGRRHAVSRWKRDRPPAYERLTQALGGLRDLVAGRAPEHVGPYDPDWRPW